MGSSFSTGPATTCSRFALTPHRGPSNPKGSLISVAGHFSPDGHWIVYRSNSEIYVQPFPLTGLRTQISTSGGMSPVWRGDGKEILFWNDSTIYSVRVEAKGARFHAETPVALFKVRVPDGLVGEAESLAVTRDGSRLLFEQAVEQPDPALTYVTTNWDTKSRR
jgi:hypothetical protein